MAVNKVNNISKETKVKAKLKSPLLLPNNPSEKGLTPSQIKKAMSAHVLDDRDSAFGEIDRVVNEINEVTEGINQRLVNNENVSHIHDNKLLLDSYDQSNEVLKETVSKKHVHENKSTIDTYNMTQEALLNLAGNSPSGDSQTLIKVKEELLQQIEKTYSQSKNEWTQSDNEISKKTESNYLDLQSQIDAINAAQNVVDIVCSYAELESFDVSNLCHNDKIGVLNDETQNNTYTYYRRDVVNNEWVLIGSVTLGMTLSQAQALFATKNEVDKIPNQLSTTNNSIVLSKDEVPISTVKVKSINGKTILGEGELTLANYIEISSLDALTVIDQLNITQLIEEFKEDGTINYKKAGDTFLVHKTITDYESIADYYSLTTINYFPSEGIIYLFFKSVNTSKSELLLLLSDDDGESWTITRVKLNIDAKDVTFSSKKTLEELMQEKINADSVYTKEEMTKLLAQKQDLCIINNALQINTTEVLKFSNLLGYTAVILGNDDYPLHISTDGTRPTISIDVGDEQVTTKIATFYDLAQLIGTADSTMDTLGELAQAIKENEDVITTLNKAISNKANSSEVYKKTETYNQEEIKSLMGNNKAVVDTTLDISSDNALQNKVITSKFQELDEKLVKQANYYTIDFTSITQNDIDYLLNNTNTQIKGTLNGGTRVYTPMEIGDTYSYYYCVDSNKKYIYWVCIGMKLLSVTDSGVITLNADTKLLEDSNNAISNSVVYAKFKEIEQTLANKQTVLKQGTGILISTDNTISVETTTDAEQDNTLPMSSSGVYTIVGNIEELLKII